MELDVTIVLPVTMASHKCLAMDAENVNATTISILTIRKVATSTVESVKCAFITRMVRDVNIVPVGSMVMQLVPKTARVRRSLPRRFLCVANFIVSECACNQCGSESCNRLTGECRCKMNVVGETCDKCAEGFYGFNTCQGCQSCNCNEGAHDQNCDNETG